MCGAAVACEFCYVVTFRATPTDSERSSCHSNRHAEIRLQHALRYQLTMSIAPAIVAESKEKHVN